MSSKKPPIPEENKSPKGTGSDPQSGHSDLPQSPDDRAHDTVPDRADARRDTTVQGNAGKRVRT